jgi:drug/metabolite transporter (DMT)-like permease
MMKNAFMIYAAATCGLLVVFNNNVQVEAFTSKPNRATVTTARTTPKSSTSIMPPSQQPFFLLQSTSTKEHNASTSLTTEISSPQEQLKALNVLQNDVDVPLLSLSTEEGEDGNGSWLEPLAWRGVILILCALWASNFAAAKLVMAEPGVDSSLYALARFGVAATALAPGALNAAKRANMDWETLKASLICGSWVAFGYLGQTLGLMTTTASKSCVICSMHCVFVAVIAELWRVQRSEDVDSKFDLSRLFPAALAVLGVAIVELKGAGGAPTIGDALSFAQPIGFGMGYLQLEELMSKKPEAALPVSALKLMVVAIASFGMFELSPLFHGATEFALQIPDFGPILASPLALGGILYTGLVTTAFALWVESIAFAKVRATDASIILTTEPLIAAGFGAVALGETFGSSDYVGAALIVGACALAVLLDAPSHETVNNGQGL